MRVRVVLKSFSAYKGERCGGFAPFLFGATFCGMFPRCCGLKSKL